MKQFNQHLAKHTLAYKVGLHTLLLLPLLYMVLAVTSQSWGGDPVQAIIHFLAETALHVLILTLLLAPLSRRYRLPALLKFRRMIGLYVAFYALAHVLAYWLLELGLSLQLFITELAKRPYIWLGMLCFVVLLALSLTSFRAIQSKLGKRWLQLHGLLFPTALLVIWHYWWSLKSGWQEPAIYLALVVALLLWKRLQVQRWLLSFRS